MQRLSVIVTDSLFHALELKSQEHEISLSDTMRECFSTGLKYFRKEIPAAQSTQIADTMIQKRIAMHTIFTYCLLEELVKDTVPNGEGLCQKAESKAEKLTLSMMQKLFKTEN